MTPLLAGLFGTFLLTGLIRAVDHFSTKSVLALEKAESDLEDKQFEEAYAQPPEVIDPFEVEYLEMIHDKRAAEEAELGYAETSCECPAHKGVDFEWNVNVAEVNRTTALAKTQIEYIPYVTPKTAVYTPNSIRSMYVPDPYSEKMREKAAAKVNGYIIEDGYRYPWPSNVPDHAILKVNGDPLGHWADYRNAVYVWVDLFSHEKMFVKIVGLPESCTFRQYGGTIDYDKAIARYKSYGNSEYWHKKEEYEIYTGDRNQPIGRFKA